MLTRVPIPASYRTCNAVQTFHAPGTRHQNIVLKMAAALLHHVESANLGHVFHAPCDVFLSRETVLQPDILFVRNNRRGIIGQKQLCGMPDLVIEVLPHNHQPTDFQAKKRVCSRYGIQEFWAVNFARENVEIMLWSELGYICMGGYGRSDRLSSPLLPNLNLPLSKIFGK